jgi:hypothetical protein
MISADQREKILKRLCERDADGGKIGAELGLPKMTVAAVKAWVTIGHYTGDSAILSDTVAEATETTCPP